MAFCPHRCRNTLQFREELSPHESDVVDMIVELTLLVHGAGTGPLVVWNMFAIVRSTSKRFVSLDLGSGVSQGVSLSRVPNNASTTPFLSPVDLYAAGLLAKTRRRRSITV
jgi:hypothetical protein